MTRLRRAWRRVAVVAGIGGLVASSLFALALVSKGVVSGALSELEDSRSRESKEHKEPMRYDPNNLDEQSEIFFKLAWKDSPCVKRLDNVEWIYKNTPGYVSGFTTMFEFSKEGYVYNFFYVENPGKYAPYHLTVRVNTVEGDRLVHAASLQNNRFVTGIGAPVMEEKWKRLLDGQVQDYLDKDVPEAEQEKWNQKILEEYSAVLRCYYDEPEEAPAL